MTNLIVDEGNTAVKIALFAAGKCTLFSTFSKEDLTSIFATKVSLKGVQRAIVASVVAGAEQRWDFLKALIPEVLIASNTMLLPFKNLYATPHTLGVDRIALVAGAQQHFPNTDVLVIDAGTCITFDFINRQGEYLGGAIAPGIAMRLKAMHHFTSQLPLIEEQDFDTEQFIGNSTQSCMLSGVYHNTVCEIEGVIAAYLEKYPALQVVLTGGQQFYLHERIKYQIFASSLVLLEGLNALLEYQLQANHHAKERTLNTYE